MAGAATGTALPVCARRIGWVRPEVCVSAFRVDFQTIPWEEPRPGVRHKVYREGRRQIRLVEFASSDGDPRWCEKGHIGFVLHGGLTIDVNGTEYVFSAGDGIFLPTGADTAHRGLHIVPGTRLLMVEDVE